MNTDDFEKQLQRQSLRQPPAAWREEILRTASANCQAVQRQQPSAFSPATWWSELILPARHIWGGLAAVWLVIAAVAVATHDGVPMLANAAPPAQVVVKALQAQQQLRAELIGQFELVPADRPKDTSLRPRTERRIETAVV